MRIIFIAVCVILAACSNIKKHEPREIERSFYYWKSVFKLSTEEKNAITDLKIQTLYIKYFDIDWNDASQIALPIAQLTMPDSNFLRITQLNIVPTVFITNETIFKINILQTKELAENIMLLVKKMNINFGISIKEMQIDCDWTESTKEKYFSLLKYLKQLDNELIFSATIRLHQIKYLNKTGVPPVKKGMLMCYNMGNLANVETHNSILELNETKKYIGNLNTYPLPLDVAFPLFEWKVLFRQGIFKGLMENMPDSLMNENIFTKKENKYVALVDTTICGYEIKRNDVVRLEQCSYSDLLQVVNLISNKLKTGNIKVSLFDLDKLTLKKYTQHEIENICDAMR